MSAKGRFVSGQRLVWLTGALTAKAWNEHWDIGTANETTRRAQEGSYPWHTLYRRYIEPGARVIDGGCGLGLTVVGLRAQGYDAIGVEQSQEMVDIIRSLAPECPVLTGDVSDLNDFADGEFDAYVSLGVVEHFPDGPGVPLAEAARVLRPGGIAFVTVPYLNLLRRMKIRLRIFATLESEMSRRDFYQYAFSRADFETELASAGFQLVAFKPFSTFAGIRRELGSLVHRLVAIPLLRKAANALEYAPGMPNAVGHMAMYVAVKQDQ